MQKLEIIKKYIQSKVIYHLPKQEIDLFRLAHIRMCVTFSTSYNYHHVMLAYLKEFSERYNLDEYNL